MRVNENVRIDQTLFTDKCIKFSYYMFVTVTVIKGITNKDFVILLTRRLHAAITYPAKNIQYNMLTHIHMHTEIHTFTHTHTKKHNHKPNEQTCTHILTHTYSQTHIFNSREFGA